MRSIAPRRPREEEEESVFVSMTDMTVSFLIILMILLAFFASRFTDEEMVPRTQLLETQALVATLQETVATLSRRAQITPEDLVRLQEALLDARSQAQDMQEALLAERQRLQAELDRARQERDAAEARLARLQDQMTAREETLSAARATIDALTETIRRLEEELARLRPLIAEVERLRARVAELQQQLDEMRRPDPLEEYLRQVAQSRRIALRDLRDAIRQEFPDLQVVISSESDALRFQGEGLFASDSRTLAADKRRIVERIAELLDGLLPCYSLGPRSAHDIACNPGFAVIEAVQIEGHTDADGSDNYNMDLASGRAVSTYTAMSRHVPELLSHVNLEDEPVLSVAGYGEARPVASNETPEGRATNRRIDLRFIMVSPSQSEEIEIIRRRLSEGTATGGGP